MKIQKLPEEAISKLQSGLVITDAVQCVLELVHNSLDAEATGVAVRTDLRSYQIRVIDNGKGISKEDFELVGEKFATSKYVTHRGQKTAVPMYGFRGQALFSLTEVCKSLTIETKSEHDGPTYKKTFQNNHMSEVIEITSERSGTGTTVTVEDFMCTMPVRRKRISEVFDIEDMKNQLQYLALIHYNVCFTLRNENKGVIVLQTPQASSMLEAVSNIFGKAVARSLKPVNLKEKKYEITGFISLKPQVQSSVQLLYINKRIIAKGVTHKFINNVIKQYIAKSNLCENSPTDHIFKNLRNSCHNVFVLEIHCPQALYELFTNGRKTTVEFKNWEDVLKCIHKAVKQTFKEVLNMDSSSNIREDENESSENEKDKCTGVFGTSVLVNAVKGAQVKRVNPTKREHKGRHQKRLKETTDKPLILEPENRKPVNKLLKNCKSFKDVSHDSLESPIPKKKQHKCAEFKTPNKTTSVLNQSYLEFYKWVKAKLKTDQNAFKLYNDFLNSKSVVNPLPLHPTVEKEFKSPVVGGKLKRKRMASPKKIKKKQENEENEHKYVSTLDEEMAIVTHQQLKIFPSTHLRMKNTVKFTSKANDDFNIRSIEAEGTSISREAYNLPKLREPLRGIELNSPLPSIPSSEIQLTNVLKFRNWSENFQKQPNNEDKDKPQETAFCPTSGTWASHYKEFLFDHVHLQRQNVAVVPLFGKDLIQTDEIETDRGYKNILPSINLDESTSRKDVEGFHDAEIQVNMSEIPLQVNVAVQTSQIHPSVIESPYFRSGGITGVLAAAAGYNSKPSEVNNLSQEPPNPDFWNTSLNEFQDNSLEEAFSPNELNTKTPTPALLNEKNSTSSEFLCGQKSNSVKKPPNESCTSKETQTFAGLWPDSLNEIFNKNSDSKSESTLPKTIPAEEIALQPEFCLTERHDFIPKGLSPTFFNMETNKTFSLSPGEKNRLKLTVDSARSDMLANVKWQDETTGDNLKPTFPDEILQEMREKAGKNALSLENSVLSATLSYCAVKVHNLLHSFAFTKELLSDVEILGQLDNKFIVAKIKLSIPKKMELISLFDQHAVDERIQLEDLIKDNSLPDGKFISRRLNPPVVCLLNESDVRVLSDLHEKISRLGLHVEIVNENTISVSEVPAFLVNKHEKDLKNKKDVLLSDDLQALITNIVNELRETRGALSKIPKVIHNAFCLEACHSAIKFNRALSMEKMGEMINKLKTCKLPFQCAHGRPSVIPIIDLQDFQEMMKQNESNELEKLKKFVDQSKRKTLCEKADAE